MSYLLLKHVHVTCVVLSGLGFCLRGYWMLRQSAALQLRLTKVMPHLIDSLLLISAVSMAVLSGQYPFVQSWLTAKFCGLLAYIFLGSMALKRGKTAARRTGFFGLAVLAYVYIVSVALTRQPLLFV
ncbi:MAG: regulator SirB [Rhodocyclales bacterium GT-UBC]|nr:MAG: regulator SirB [Rhodocyclales bacterium GT-UBC]